MESTAPTWESVVRSILVVALVPLTVVVAMSHPLLLVGILAGLLFRGSARYGRQVLRSARRDVLSRLDARENTGFEYRTQVSRDK